MTLVEHGDLIFLRATRRMCVPYLPQPFPAPTPREIAASIAKRHGLTLADITGRDRRWNLAAVRQEIMWTLRQRTKLTTTQIGRLLNRDHSTVLHGIKRFADGRFRCGAASDERPESSKSARLRA